MEVLVFQWRLPSRIGDGRALKTRGGCKEAEVLVFGRRLASRRAQTEPPKPEERDSVPIKKALQDCRCSKTCMATRTGQADSPQANADAFAAKGFQRVDDPLAGAWGQRPHKTPPSGVAGAAPLQKNLHSPCTGTTKNARLAPVQAGKICYNGKTRTNVPILSKRREP